MNATKPPAAPGRALKQTASVLVAGGVFLACAGLAYLLLTPKIYVASATVKVWQYSGVPTNDSSVAYDPALLSGECQAMRSDALLDQVVQSLRLNETNGGGASPPSDARALLKSMLAVAPIPKTSVIRVSVSSGNPAQIAAIANEIVRVWRNYRSAQQDTVTHDRVSSLDVDWQEVNRKLAVARTNVARLRAEAAIDTSSNEPRLFQPQAYEYMQSNRIALESELSRRQQELDRLKTLDRAGLQQALPVLDGRTNQTLLAYLGQLNRARSALTSAQTLYGPDSPEVKNATAAVAGSDKAIEQTIDGTMKGLEAEFSSLATALDAVKQSLRNATTNENEIIALHPDYEVALREYAGLEKQRDALQQRMREADATAAFSAAALGIQMVDSAETPDQPASPNRKAGIMVISCGILAAAFGLCLPFLRRKPKSAESGK